MTNDERDRAGVEETAAAEQAESPVATDVETPAAAAPAEPRRPIGERVGGALDRAQARVGAGVGRAGDAVLAIPVGRWWRRVERPGIGDWVLLGAVSLLAFVTFLYGDVRVTYEHTFNFLDAVAAGRVQDFYQIAIDNGTFGHPAVYDIPVYMVFAVWNLPTWLIHQVVEFDYLSSVPAQLWAKAMMVFFLVVAVKVLMDIARTAGMSVGRSRWVGFVFASSMAVIVPVLVIVQYDIVSVAVMLLGIRAYLQGRTRAFLLWFLAANTLKLFSVFVFIPLILLKEKRLLHAGGQLVVGMLGLVVCRLLYRGDVAYEISTGGFTDLMLQRLTVAGVPWHSGFTVPLFVVTMVGLAIFAYVRRADTPRELLAFATYLPLVAFLAFSVLVPLNPYWIVLMAPFSALIIFLNPRHLTLNVLLETSIATALVLIYSMVGFSMYTRDMFAQLLLGRVLPGAEEQRFRSVQDLLVGAGLDKYLPFLIGFLLACAVAVLVLNYPRRSLLEGMPNVEPVQRSVMWLRLVAVVAFFALQFAMYLLPAKPPLYSSVTDTPITGAADIMLPGSSVEQDFVVESDAAVEELQVGFSTDAQWINTAAVALTLVDASGTEVYSGTAPVNALGVGLTAFETPGLVLAGGETYTVRLTTQESDSDGRVFVLLNPAVDRELTLEDGQEVAGDLMLQVVGSPQ
ncbi:hypothetical protein [Agrococcus jejuensis]|uniref:DUF2029 domain-containing protein n=1 Tax=Agrococcus jejuensis TaxID=399736 RepID=A0A1G8EJ97_9MICO|nr:hypothetical protein [Agrococcus jejuensis]SDH69941.1 hypothetical protein SAMN04489720_2065 [Agrococcus jejuensis]